MRTGAITITTFMACGGLLLASSTAHGDTLYFDGDTDNNIQTASNWTGDILPTSGIHVGVVGSGTNVVFNDRYISALDIAFEGTSSLERGAGLATRLQNGTMLSFLDSSSWDNLTQNVIIGYAGTATVNWDSSGTLSALGGAKLDVGRSTVACFLNQSDGLIEVGTQLQVLSGSVYALSGGRMNIAGYIDMIDVGAYIDLLTTGTTGSISIVNGGADYTSALQGFIDAGKIRIDGVAQTGYSLFDIGFDGSKTTISVGDGISQPSPQILSFFSSEDWVPSNTTVTLDWATTNATYASLDQGIGEVTATGSTNVLVTEPVTFTLSATNAFGITTRSVSIGIATPRPPASSGPNIVFVLVDDWGWTDHSNAIAAEGFESDFYQTPNFSRLVDAGVTFTSTYAQPNCAPTRAALLSGQYSCRRGNGVYNVDSLSRAGARTTYTTPANQGDEFANGDEQTITIGEAFINSGYVTAHFGKYHCGSSNPADPTYPLNQGFDFNYGGKNDGAPGTYFASGGSSSVFGPRIGPELDPFAADYTSAYIADNLDPYSTGNNPASLVGTHKHLTDAMGDAFISFMNHHQSGSMSNYPVYAQVHFYAVHGPIEPRPDLKTKYDGLPEGTYHDDPEYAGLVEGMDHTLGRIMDYLADPNGDGDTADSIAENTLLVFCSDNGGTAESNLPLRNMKGTHFDGGIRVPCVVSMPGTIPTNKVSDTLVHVVDFYPTMLDFAGGVYPDSVTHPLDGVSLHDHLLDPDHVARNRGPIFYHFPGYMDTRAYNCSVVIKDVGGKRYKYIYSYDPYYGPSDEYDQYQLYCLTTDIGETTNLLDYIDVEVSGTDPSTTEEYWNYILYKKVGNELAADLHNWLDHGSADPNGSADPTWTPIYATYKSTFPGIAPEWVGQETGPAPDRLPEFSIPDGQIFKVLGGTPDEGALEVTLKFTSAEGFTYAIDASTNLINWVEIESGIPGQVNSTICVVNDPDLATGNSHFYRARLKAN